MACNFNFICLVEIKELLKLLKVTSSHVHSKSGNISKMGQERRHCYRPLIGSDMYGLSDSGNADDLA